MNSPRRIVLPTKRSRIALKLPGAQLVGIPTPGAFPQRPEKSPVATRSDDRTTHAGTGHGLRPEQEVSFHHDVLAGLVVQGGVGNYRAGECQVQRRTIPREGDAVDYQKLGTVVLLIGFLVISYGAYGWSSNQPLEVDRSNLQAAIDAKLENFSRAAKAEDALKPLMVGGLLALMGLGISFAAKKDDGTPSEPTSNSIASRAERIRANRAAEQARLEEPERPAEVAATASASSSVVANVEWTPEQTTDAGGGHVAAYFTSRSYTVTRDPDCPRQMDLRAEDGLGQAFLVRVKSAIHPSPPPGTSALEIQALRSRGSESNAHPRLARVFLHPDNLSVVGEIEWVEL